MTLMEVALRSLGIRHASAPKFGVLVGTAVVVQSAMAGVALYRRRWGSGRFEQAVAGASVAVNATVALLVVNIFVLHRAVPDDALVCAGLLVLGTSAAAPFVGHLGRSTWHGAAPGIVESRPWQPTSFSPIRLLLDSAAILGAVSLAYPLHYTVRFLALVRPGAVDGVALLLGSVLWSACVIVALHFNRLYDEDTIFDGGGQFGRIATSLAQSFVLFSALSFFVKPLDTSRGWMLLVAFFTGVAICLERFVLTAHIRYERARGDYRRPAILVSADGRGTPQWLQGESNEFEVIAHVNASDLLLEPSTKGSPRPQLSQGVVVIVDSDSLDEETTWRVLVSAGQSGCSAFLRTPVRPVSADRLSSREMRGHSIVKIAPPALKGLRALQKRTLDIAISGCILLIFSPLFLGLSVAVALTSGLPIFYRQERVGKDGKVFSMWKFRSMRPGSDKEAPTSWTAVDDPRRTPIGKFLRRTSLDEIPQFWNVLVGDMSIVGPRPERPNLVEAFARDFEWYEFRHRIRPGITGWAQCTGLRGNTSLESRVEFDNRYIEYWTIWLDLQILIKTVAEIFRGEHAY
jgi:exopolysaccharide biosynthesis polyprenyl glycosylphosphotransferase